MSIKIKLALLLLNIITIIAFGQTQLGQTIDVEEPFFAIGASTSSSFDGNRIAVGGAGKSNWGFRVYEYFESEWIQIGNDVNTDYPNNTSVYRVSLSSNGNIIAVSALILDNNFTPFGHVKLYEFNGVDWNQIGNTLYGESNDDYFGDSLSLSANGDRLIVGARFNNNSQGNARVFEFNGIDWVQLGLDIDGDPGQYYFGFTVSISSNGQIVAVGANQFDVNGISNAGLVRVFEYNEVEWIQIGEDMVGENNSDNFGAKVSLSNDGNRIAVGAAETTTREGFIQVFEFNGSNWFQIGTTIHGENIGDRTYTVSLSGNGDRLAISSSFNWINEDNLGYVKIYELNDTNWLQIGLTIEGESIADYFGSNFCISEDGNSIAIGSFKLDVQQSGSEVGYTKVFDLSDLVLSIKDFEPNKNDIYPNPAVGFFRIRNSQNIKNINIFDSTGKLVKEEVILTEKIDISSLGAGIYFINLITFQNNTVNLKLVIK